MYGTNLHGNLPPQKNERADKKLTSLLLDISLGAKEERSRSCWRSKDSQSSNRIRVCDGERGRRQEIDAGGHLIVEAIILLESEATSRVEGRQQRKNEAVTQYHEANVSASRSD